MTPFVVVAFPLAATETSPNGDAPARPRRRTSVEPSSSRPERTSSEVLALRSSSQLSADEALLQTFARFVFALSGASASCPTHRGGRGPGGKLSAQVLSKSDAARTRPRGISRSPPHPESELKTPRRGSLPQTKGQKSAFRCHFVLAFGYGDCTFGRLWDAFQFTQPHGPRSPRVFTSCTNFQKQKHKPHSGNRQVYLCELFNHVSFGADDLNLVVPKTSFNSSLCK